MRLINLAEPAAGCRSPQDYGDDVRLLLQTGLGISAVEYLQAQRYRTMLREQVLAAFCERDVILAPTLPFTAPLKGEEQVAPDWARPPCELQ